MKKGVLIFVEGDTEKELYCKFFDMLRGLIKNGKFNVNKIEIKNLKGIGNFKTKARRIYQNDILKNNPDVVFDIFLCYDTDVFESFSSKPPVDWKGIEKVLREFGAQRVIHIKAKKSIEDWIMRDSLGVIKYLRLPNNTKIPSNNGLEQLKYLFKKKNKIYVKGVNVDGFIDKLNLEIIMCRSCSQLKPLCRKIGVKCKI